MVKELPAGHAIMQNIDRFFDTYDRILPRWFTDAAITAILVGPLLLWIMS